jgi:hypothetical protein
VQLSYFVLRKVKGKTHGSLASLDEVAELGLRNTPSVAEREELITTTVNSFM